MKTYYVGQNEENKNLTKLFFELKDDDSDKKIIIREGTYDIYKEYRQLNINVPNDDEFNPIMGYVPYCAFIPTNTLVVGEGKVILKFMPDKDEITINESKVFSPINVAGTMTLENVEIHSKNSRYCIHDDPLGNDKYNGAKKIYKNVICYKYPNDEKDGKQLGVNHTIGFGIDRQMHYEFIDCVFNNLIDHEYCGAFYMHDRAKVGGVTLTKEMSSEVFVKNCLINPTNKSAVLMGSGYNNDICIPITFDTCKINGYVLSSNESDRTMGSAPNSYQFTFINCGDIDLRILDVNNKYNPTIK